MHLKNKFQISFISLLIVIYIILSLPIGSPSNGPEPVKVSYPYTYNAKALDFSPDGKFLAVGYDEGFIRIWNLENGEDIYDPEGSMEEERLMRTLGRHDITHVSSVKFSPDGKYLLSGGYLSKHENKDVSLKKRNESEQIDVSEVKLWNIETGECFTHYTENNSVYSVAFSPDGSSYAASSKNGGTGENVIYIRDTETHEVLNSITSSNAITQSLVFTPDGKYLVASYTNSADGPNIVFWNLESITAARIIETRAIIRDLDFSDDGSIFAGVSDRNGQIRIWDTETGDLLNRFYALKGILTTIDLSPDGEYIAGTRKGRMVIWNVSSGDKILDVTSLPEVGDYLYFSCLQFSPETEYLACGVRVPINSSYYFSYDDYVQARKADVSHDLLSPLDGDNPVFLWNFEDIKKGDYVESLWDKSRKAPLLYVIILWAPTILVLYLVIVVTTNLIRMRKAK